MADVCEHCGCPQIGDNLEYWIKSWHYASCPIVTIAKGNEYYGGYHTSGRRDSILDVFKEYAEGVLSQISYEIGKIKAARDEVTNACLDEVYLCRYDCIDGRLVAAI